MIDLFKLHDNTEDKGAYSWIVVGGPEVFENFQFLIKKITEELNYSIKSLSRKISKRIGCSASILYDILNGRTKLISLVLISDLLSILREADANKAAELKNKFLYSIKFLKSNPRSTAKIKAVKKLSTELAEFCGIHAADGSLNLVIDIESKKEKPLVKIRNKLHKKFPEIRISKIKRTRGKTKHGFYFYITNKTRTRVLNYLNRRNIGFSLAYKIEFVDSGENSMEYLRKLIANQFGYNIKIKTKGRGNWYYVLFSNKIIGRYLKNIFDFPIGKKSDIVEAPELIKKAPFSIQKAFMRGFMQFDGSVKRKGSIAFSTNSKKLLSFFLRIIRKDNLNGTTWARKGRKRELTFESPPSKQWLTYFIKGTPKHQRLYEHIYGFTEETRSVGQAIKIFEKAFPSTSRSFLTFLRLIKTVSELEEFTRYQILNKLKSDYVPKDYKSLLTKLDILEKANIIKVNPVKMTDRFEEKSDKITFNNKVKEWKLPLVQDQNIDDVVEVVHNAGLSKKVVKLKPLAVIKGE